MSGVAQVLSAVADVWALRIPAAVFGDAGTSVPVAVGVALLAGVSTMLGHAVVFAINRVRGLRLVAVMALGAVYMALLRVAIGAAVAGIAWAVARGRVDVATIAVVYLVAIAPKVLGVLEFLPHLGIGIGRLLEAWSVAALVVLLAQVLSVSGWQALAIGGGVWVAAQLVSRLLARPVATLSSRVWTLATGHETFLTAHDVMAGVPFVPLERTERPA